MKILKQVQNDKEGGVEASRSGIGIRITKGRYEGEQVPEQVGDDGDKIRLDDSGMAGYKKIPTTTIV